MVKKKETVYIAYGYDTFYNEIMNKYLEPDKYDHSNSSSINEIYKCKNPDDIPILYNHCGKFYSISSDKIEPADKNMNVAHDILSYFSRKYNNNIINSIDYHNVNNIIYHRWN